MIVDLQIDSVSLRARDMGLEAELMIQIQKDFQMVGLPLPESLLVSELTTDWRAAFKKHLQWLNNVQKGKLIQLFYRIDVDEKHVIDLNVDSCHQLADLILTREKEKVKFRRNHK